WQFDSSGAATNGRPLNNFGPNFTLQSGATVIGMGAGFYGGTNPDLFIRRADGHIEAWQFSNSTPGVSNATNGRVLSNSDGSNIVLENGATVIGTGMGFFGGTNPDVFIRHADGRIEAWQFDNSVPGVSTATDERPPNNFGP